MPIDKRLYMTFPNDFHRHPKLTRLPVEARWAFVEMNGEARIADNDGVFDAADAEFTWTREILDVLVGSHPTRPLVARVGETYVIRDYAEHQQTRAQRDDLHEKRAAAGAAGAAARKANRLASAKQVLSKPEQSQAESESESEDFYSPSKSQSRNTRARVSTDAIPVSEMTKRLAAQQGITSLRSVVDAIHRHTSATVDADQALQVSLWLIGKSKDPVKTGQRYVLGCIEQTPAEVEQHIFEAVA
jgi:hypothetical protein